MTSDASSAEPRAAPRPWLFTVAALLAVTIVYAETLGGAFVWDDRYLIEDAPLVTEPQPLSAYFANPFWVGGEQGSDARAYYRPLVTLSYALDHALHGANPAGFHLTNLLLHLLNVGLVLSLARRAGASAAGAALVATAWGVLPRLSESVAWISGRTDVLATAFMLVALLVMSRPRAGPWLAALALLCALCAKEVALALLVALMVRALLAPASRRKAELVRVLPSVGAAAVYLFVRARVLTDSATDPLQGVGSARAVAALAAVGRYASMIIDPVEPNTQIGYIGRVEPSYAVIGAATVLLCGFAAYRFRRRLMADRARATALSLALASLASVLHVVPLPINVVAADRFLYLPMAGVAIAGAAWIAERAERSRLTLAAALCLIGVFGVVTHRRVQVWNDEITLWTEAATTSHPDNPLPWLELGNLHYRLALYDRALAYYARAARVDPGLARFDVQIVEATRGSTLSLVGRHDEARAVLERVVRERADVPKFWLDLAVVRLHAFDFSGARAAARNALALHPEYGAAQAFLDQVAELEAEARALPPAGQRDAGALRKRARFLGRAGRPREAATLWLALLDTEDARAADADEALELAGRYGTLEQARSVLQRRRALGGEPDPQLSAALAWRFEQAERLLKAASALETASGR